jgi:hypothetical protein
MSDRRVYLDTSAYLAVLLGEKQATAVQRAVKGSTLCSSTLLLLEAERNLVRLARQGGLSEKVYEAARAQLVADQELFVLRDLTPELCLNNEFPAIQTPRSADLAHLRTAKWFQGNGGLHLFVSLDVRQLSAAESLGLPRGG